MTVPISVITCTHNPKPQYFQRVLDALAAQTLSPSQWDYLVIDNCSRESVAKVFDLSCVPRARVSREETLGLTPARLRGIRESRGTILVFVDDDNILAPDYLEETWRIAVDYSFLGSWSGQCFPEFEEKPPEWTRRYWGNLAIREFAGNHWSNQPRLASTMPCGAGLTVRRSVAERYQTLHQEGGRSFQLDRKGNSLLSAGDNDLAACACDIGLGQGIFERLKLTHLISAGRLTEEYIVRLAEGIHYSSVILDALREIRTPPRNLAGRLIDWVRVLRLPPPHNRIAAAAFRGRDRAAREIAGQFKELKETD